MLFATVGRMGEAQSSNRAVKKNSTIDFTKETQRVESVFEREPTHKAYRWFADSYHNVQPQEAHDLAHIVGTILYRKYGSEGIRYCDDVYSGGCFRGFFVQAFLTKSEAPPVSCLEAPDHMRSQCFRAIGHGLLVRNGYTVAGIERSLSSCENYQEGFPTCAGGVFTEYNTQRSSQLMHGTRVSVTLEKERLYEPCVSLSLYYQDDCFLDQPPRWFVHVTEDPEKIASLCQGVEGTSNREACFRGIARITPHAIQDVAYRRTNFCMAIDDLAGQAVCEQELTGQ